MAAQKLPSFSALWLKFIVQKMNKDENQKRTSVWAKALEIVWLNEYNGRYGAGKRNMECLAII